MSPHQTTDNDEAIAQALAREEQERVDAEIARKMDPNANRNDVPVVTGRWVHPPRLPSNQPLQQQPPFPSPGLSGNSQSHMCIVPCVMGDGCAVEMIVDTGAQSSVLSLPLAQQLGLKIDKSHQGVAVGVGRARVVGMVRNIICELGHVEFHMDFAVLDAPEKLLLLGLDLMRRYKCIVDLERDVLVFGGKGGVEVQMLPAEEQHIVLRNQYGCPMM